MAFSATDRVKVVDQSSEYRGLRGSVQAVEGDYYRVRLETQGCGGNETLFRESQLATDTSTMKTDYAQCSG